MRLPHTASKLMEAVRTPVDRKLIFVPCGLFVCVCVCDCSHRERSGCKAINAKGEGGARDKPCKWSVTPYGRK